jgi:dihydroneopterin aldolase
MDVIHICDLEVSYRVGVPDTERATPQRLLLDIKLFADFADAAARDDLSKTIDYFAVTQRLLTLGDGRQWKLIEKLAEDIASTLLVEFSATQVRVEIKKFIIPQTRYVSVAVERRK